MLLFAHSVAGVVEILLMIALGYLLTNLGWFDEKASKLIARLVTQVALPAYMAYTIVDKFTFKRLVTTLPDLRFPVLSMMILFVVSIVLARVLHIKKTHVGLFESMFFNSNTVFVGLPVNVALFGEAKSLPYILVYYMANTTIFWTLGVYLIQRDGQGDYKFSLSQTLKKIFSPPLLGFMVGVVLVLLKIQLPQFIMADLNYVGGLTVPLSMIFIGIAVANVSLHDLTLTRANLGILFGRFIAAPALMALLVLPTGMPIMMKQVFIIQSAMPVMTNAPVVSKLYGADSSFAAVMVTETTLMSLLVIPILMVLLNK
ncbi:malate transporter [Secundilactobacillus paracollinoides]|uniref:Malate transporter n=1 Tax=Secundilactobacillus paracollinoides TaxID=240427 RepID=A0A1B2J2E8_9LACO|nr:malate transporter [Secundilactobacillus paracollinoides]ANZ65432.1 malate transporter [Secundilactobacillus paracollinoides]ANZ68439.1 malate transporter [Secundilactobacillus paracollinoides]